MKQITYILLLTTLLLSCQEETLEEKPATYWGEMSAVLNGEPWTGKTRMATNQGCYKGKMGLSITRHSVEGFERERLSFSKLPHDTGTFFLYPLNDGLCDDNDEIVVSFNTSEDDGDVHGKNFLPWQEAHNWIEITHYNTETGEMWAEFEATLVLNPLYYDRTWINYPDTLRFTKGRFHVKILGDEGG